MEDKTEDDQKYYSKYWVVMSQIFISVTLSCDEASSELVTSTAKKKETLAFKYAV